MQTTIDEEKSSESDFSIEHLVKSYSGLLSFIMQFGAVLTALGGSILILYLLQIKYIPPVGLTDLALLFTSSALIGMMIFIWIGLLPLLISLPWRLLLQNKTANKILLRDEWLEQIRVFSLWCSLPVVLIAIYLYFLHTFKTQIIILVIVAALISAVYLVALIRIKKISILQSLLFLFVSIVSALMMVVVLSFWGLIAREAFERENGFNQWILFALIMIVMFAVSTLTIRPHTIISANFTESVRSGIWSAMVTAVGVVILFQAIGFSTFTNAVVRNLGVGGYKNVTIVLDEVGKNTLNSLGINCTNAAEEKYCVVKDLKILWGRGDEYLFRYVSHIDSMIIQANRQPKESIEFNFTLPGNSILSLADNDARVE